MYHTKKNREEPISKERLAEITAIPDCDIDTSDIPEANEDFFRKARLVMSKCPPK